MADTMDMFFDVEELKTLAKDCMGHLKKDDIEYLKKNIPYIRNHFGFGLYLRNNYYERVSGELGADFFSEELYRVIIAELFPEFGTDYKIIGYLIECEKFAEIFACYYMKTGRLVISDFPISQYEHVEFDDTALETIDDEDEEAIEAVFDEWYMEFKKRIDRYVYPMAEALWDYEKFKLQAVSDGINEQILDEWYKQCKKVFDKKYIFMPLELVYYSEKGIDKRSGIAEFCKEYLEYFAGHHFSQKDLLPKYILEDSELVKILDKEHLM